MKLRSTIVNSTSFLLTVVHSALAANIPRSIVIDDTISTRSTSTSTATFETPLTTSTSASKSSSSNHTDTTPIIVGTCVGIGIPVLLALLGFAVYRHRTRSSRYRAHHTELDSNSNSSPNSSSGFGLSSRFGSEKDRGHTRFEVPANVFQLPTTLSPMASPAGMGDEYVHPSYLKTLVGVGAGGYSGTGVGVGAGASAGGGGRFPASPVAGLHYGGTVPKLWHRPPAQGAEELRQVVVEVPPPQELPAARVSVSPAFLSSGHSGSPVRRGSSLNLGHNVRTEGVRAGGGGGGGRDGAELSRRGSQEQALVEKIMEAGGEAGGGGYRGGFPGGMI